MIRFTRRKLQTSEQSDTRTFKTVSTSLISSQTSPRNNKWQFLIRLVLSWILRKKRQDGKERMDNSEWRTNSLHPQGHTKGRNQKPCLSSFLLNSKRSSMSVIKKTKTNSKQMTKNTSNLVEDFTKVNSYTGK